MHRGFPLKALFLCALALVLGSFVTAADSSAAPVRIANQSTGLGTGLALDGDAVYWSSAAGGLNKTMVTSGKTERILATGQVTRIVARGGYMGFVIKRADAARRRNLYTLYRSDDAGTNIVRVATASERDFSQLGAGRICGDLISLKSVSESGRLLYAVQTNRTRGRQCSGKRSYTTRVFVQDAGLEPTIPLKPAARFRTTTLVLAAVWPWVMQVGAPGLRSLRFNNLSSQTSSSAPIRMTRRRFVSAMSSSFDQVGNALITVAALKSPNPALRDAYLYPVNRTGSDGPSHGSPLMLASKSAKRFTTCGGSLLSWTDEFGPEGKYKLEVVRNPFNPFGRPARSILPNTSRRIRQVACDSSRVVFQLAGTTTNTKSTDIYLDEL